MTSNQIAFYKAQEEARHNQVMEEIERPKVDLARAQTAKAQAEAAKTSGVDTQYIAAQTSRVGTQKFSDVAGGIKNIITSVTEPVKAVASMLDVLG